MCISFPGIISVGYLFADTVPANTIYNALAGLPINLFIHPKSVPLSGTAECIVEQSNDSNGTAESLTLTFSSALRLPRHRAVAFVITDANFRQWLIGQAERPHLSIVATQQTGSPEGESAVYRYEVKQIAPIAIKSCKIFV